MMNTMDKRLDNERIVLSAIKEWYKERSYGPSYRDLQKATGISLGNVHATCASLHDGGKIDLEENIARSIRLAKGKK
jgi:hypothetical protein